MQQKKISEPTNVDIKFILDLINSGKIIDAKKEIDKKITKFPSSSILSNILGATLAAQNEPLKAIESYNRAIKINPSYAQAYNNLAITLYKMNKVDEAIKTYKKSIDLNKSFAEPYYKLGNIMLNLEKFAIDHHLPKIPTLDQRHRIHIPIVLPKTNPRSESFH